MVLWYCSPSKVTLLVRIQISTTKYPYCSSLFCWVRVSTREFGESSTSAHGMVYSSPNTPDTHTPLLNAGPSGDGSSPSTPPSSPGLTPLLLQHLTTTSRPLIWSWMPWELGLLFLSSFLLFGHIHGKWKSLGQRLNLHQGSNLSCYSDSSRSLTH